MLRVTFASLWSHKLRLLLTVIAIVLGVAFVAGTFVLTDTLRGAFDRAFAQITSEVDVSVRGAQAFEGGFTNSRPPVPQDVVDRLAALDQVAAIDLDLQGFAQLINADGEPIGGQGPPSIGTVAPQVPGLTGTDLREGRFPEAPGEIALDAGTAALLGFSVGDVVEVITVGPATSETIVGTVGFGELDSIGGAMLIFFDFQTAKDLWGQDGFFSAALRAAEGVDPVDLKATVQELLGPSYDVETGEESGASTSAEVGTFLGFFSTGLLVFAAVALFVGAFLIANTFSIIVAGRTRELALLRAMGASRRQVLGSVLAEAAVTGLIGGLIGLGAGIGLALGLRALLGVFGIDLPEGDSVIAARTVIVSLGLGVGVTLLAALAPAVKSLRVPPVAALQAVAAPPPPRFGRVRYIVGGVILAIGVALLAGGLFGGLGLSSAGGGAAVTLIGAALLSPLVTAPIVRGVGAPIAGLRGMPGQLAKENALRSPRRTAATASALMIGLGLVSFVMIFGASITASAEASIDRAFLAEYSVRANVQGPPGSGGLSLAMAQAVNALDEVAVAAPLYAGEFRYGDKIRLVGGVDASAASQLYGWEFVAGSLDELAKGGLLITEEVAETEGWGIGDVVAAEFAATGRQDVTVRAIITSGTTDYDFAFDADTFLNNFTLPGILQIDVRLAPGVSVAPARPALEAALADFPNAQLADQEELKQSIRDQVNQLLGLMTGMLLMSVIIGLVGITNTLGLAVLERIRELGLLRAVGMTRAQVRSMVRWESVIVALLGAVFGLAIGVLFGAMVVQALSAQGITEFVLPGGQLAAAVLFAAVAGILAAVLPARRASRIDVLAAIAAE